MSGTALARSTMRFGTRFGIAAVVLIVLGPFINRNFGVGDAANLLLPSIVESAPAAVLVSLMYLVLLGLCVLFGAALITASLVIRHAEMSDESAPIEESDSHAF
ncbi:hypothetical protein [Arthrobacter sp. zg-Y1143]|uniref:hypothetical protein n=1 Tax=Arthrobacter sp. zg-Y1143 TaxID=3049065 RepID=UPI0024C24084|nr:hypothetical protein [Arthrobacter sp. zg-Y1143]MDK1327926.1 hypothetical protein [Arthrobacter sp. zg-Y1143]